MFAMNLLYLIYNGVIHMTSIKILMVKVFNFLKRFLAI